MCYNEEVKAKNKKNREKRFIILLISGIAFIGLLFTFATLSQHHYDKRRFEALSVFMKDLTSSLQSSNPPASISYEEECSDIYAGAFASGEIICQVAITSELQTTQVQDVKNLHAYYYPAVLANSELLPSGSLDIQPLEKFGKKLVVSSVEQSFKVASIDGIVCRYLLTVQPSSETSDNFSLGASISKLAKVQLEFRCSDKARDYWFVRV